VEKGTSGQGFAVNKAGWMKASQISDDELSPDNEDVPVYTAPAQLPGSISGVAINNYGSGNVAKANAATAKPTNQKIKSEEQNVVDQTKSKDSKKIKVHLSSKSRFSEVKKNEAE
jgi:hypothetical protein